MDHGGDAGHAGPDKAGEGSDGLCSLLTVPTPPTGWMPIPC
jgi:hypothetical protein